MSWTVMFARYIERKPFGEKEELKELKIWMVWNIMFMFWITMDVVNCYVQRNTL